MKGHQNVWITWRIWNAFLQCISYTYLAIKSHTNSCEKQAFTLSVQITQQNYTLISFQVFTP